MSEDRLHNILEDECKRFIPTINRIMGNMDYILSDYDFDNMGTFWFVFDFGVSGPINLSSLHLQFGEVPLILASGFFENLILGIELDELYTEIMDELRQTEILQKSFFYDVEFFEDEEDFLSFSLIIEVATDNDIPLFAEIDEIITKIKEVILAHKIELNTT